MREALTSSLAAKLGALLAEGGLRALKERMDPRRFNGGPFLGLNGIAIKSHGGTDAFGFASAIEVGYEMAESTCSSAWPPIWRRLHGKLGEAPSRSGDPRDAATLAIARSRRAGHCRFNARKTR